MSCPRCGGKMVCEPNYTESGIWWGWRCLFCGEILDPVIAENRKWSMSRASRISQNRRIGRVVQWEVR